MTSTTTTSQHFLFLVDGGVGAPRRARKLVSASVSGAGFETAFLDDLLLAVSEVVTNSVRHGDAGEKEVIALGLTFDSGCVRIEVSDDGPGFTARRRAPRFERAGGLGLQMVGTLSERWGVAGSNPTRVWFELSPAANRAY